MASEGSIDRVPSTSEDGSEEEDIEKDVTSVNTDRSLKEPEGSMRYSFLVRPRKGYTNRLRRSLLAGFGPTPINLLYEGPYGHVPNFKRFANVLLAIGGSGISVGISHIYNILEQSPEARMKLVWTCRKSKSYMDSVMERELRSALGTGRLRIDA